MPSSVALVYVKDVLYYLNVLLPQIYFRKNGFDFSDCNNVRDIFYNTDIMIFIVKLIVHSPAGKLV